jgi:hypothetical protein
MSISASSCWQRPLKFWDHALKQVHQFSQLLLLLFRDCTECFGQGFDAPLPSFLQDLCSLGGGLQAHTPSIFRFSAAHQTGAHQARDDAAHGRRADLLGFGEFAKRSWATAKNEDRQGGKLRRTDAAFTVANSQPPEKVDRRGVQPVGGLEGFSPWRFF